ncbi:MAG: hypothetical protein RQ899_11025 [Pseudomonadales bacterium]|nr:hypothetical protein [Pseudomonadales bacterium]
MLLAFPAASLRAAELPDFSGFWNFTNQSSAENPVAQRLLAALPANTAILADAGATEFPRGEFGGLLPKAAVLARAQAWTPAEELKVENICKMPSIVYAMQGPFPMEIHQGRDIIVIKLEYFDMLRVIFMDGRGHPAADAPHSKLGHSIGHWEDGDLVVETSHLASATITNNGLDHSADLIFSERFHLDGETLWATQFFTDPTNLDNAGARLMAWRRFPGEFIYPYECDPFVYQE